MIKVLICDDQSIVCEGLEKILSKDPEIEVVGIAHNGVEAVEMVAQVSPDLVLMDLKMPRMNGAVATRKLKELNPDLHVIVLTTYDDDEWIFDAVRSGAAGYLLKDISPVEIIKAIKGTVTGKNYLDPAITQKFMNSMVENNPPYQSSPHIELSEREKEILTLIAKGYSNNSIAETLFLSEGTIRNYLSDLFKTLGVNDRTQAAVMAIKFRLVKID